MQTKPIEASGAKYRWTYEMSLFKNPTVFLATAKAISKTIGFEAKRERRYIRRPKWRTEKHPPEDGS